MADLKKARVQCFFLAEVVPARFRVSLRVYGGACAKRGGKIHEAADLLLGDMDSEPASPADDDPRWPSKCRHCGEAFEGWRVQSAEHLYTRSDTKAILTIREAPDGAMWWAPWYADHDDYRGPDGRCLVVRTPGGRDWIVDSVASNCDLPCGVCKVARNKHGKSDHQYVPVRPHKCWVRSGEPPKVTAGKGKPGESCTAGAGSILTELWHGHLRNGVLEPS